MRQLLILGFYCEVYKKEPRCRVYINDVLLEEFDVLHSPYKDYKFKSDIVLNPNLDDKKSVIIRSTTPFLKYIEFDDLDKNFANIKIEIQNNDNNYVNGFITKYTRIMLPCVFLFSEKVLNKVNNIKNNWKFSIKNYHVHNKKNLDIFYSNRHSLIFNNLAKNMILNFPDIIQQKRSAEELKPYCNNWQDLPTYWKSDPGSHWIGSTGYFMLKIKKKLGFWRDNTDLRIGLCRLGWVNLVEHLYDKYKQYEDTRSIDQ